MSDESKRALRAQRAEEILRITRAHEALVRVLIAHFTAEELGVMFDQTAAIDKQSGQPLRTLVSAIGTAWAQSTGDE